MVTRANTIAVLSPKGGVGKTTCTFLLGNLVASTANLRCVAVDANPDFGTLGSLASDSSRAPGSLLEILPRLEQVQCAAELRPLIAALPTGLDLIAPPPDPENAAAMTPDVLATLTDLLGRFYDVILLDLGAGTGSPWC